MVDGVSVTVLSTLGKRLFRRVLMPFTFASFAFAHLASAVPDGLTTVAERSGFQKTGRYDEVIALCSAFEKAYPQNVRVVEFGRTPEGRPMLALIASRTGALTAAEAQKRALPVLLVQGGIHAGEIDGKDAGFLALRETLENRSAKRALEKQVLIFVPVFNVDGHERFRGWNRPNQRGPEEMGWRTTAQNFNLNRDYVKADTPEMQAMLRLVNEWDPLACIDLHVTDGAKFEHGVSVQVDPARSGDIELQTIGVAFRDAVIADLAAQGSLPLPFYPAFVSADDPASGFADNVPPPRFSNGYFQLRNRFGMLVETHSWKDYATRVRITRNAIVSVLDQVGQHGADWLKTAREADARAARLGGQDVPLDFTVTEKSRTIEFRGYEYTRTPSDISGTIMVRYDETKPQIWKLPLRDELKATMTATAPAVGYLVPVAYASWLAPKLKQQGIEFRVLNSPQRDAAVETFRVEETKLASESFENHQALAVEGVWKPETRDLLPGALFVPIAQAKARLVMAILEARAPDSLLAWGEFNIAFELKEYMEDYVAEEVAREQLAGNPGLNAEFQKKLRDDPAFAKSPTARLQFFMRRHPSWDERLNLYPILRTATVPK